MKKFINYYLPWFIIFGLLTLLGATSNGFSFDRGFLILLSITGIICPLLIGGMFDFAANIWTPRRKIKYYNKMPLSELQQIGFVNIENDYLKGKYKNYYFTIEYDHSSNRGLSYTVLYEPFSFKKDEYDRINKLLKKSIPKLQLDIPGVIYYYRKFIFKMPNYESIIDDLNKIHETLDLIKLHPITDVDLDKKYQNEENKNAI